MLTDRERELIADLESSARRSQAVSRIRRKISEELTEDVELLKSHHPELLEEMRDVICER